MAEAKIELKVGNVSFAGEGKEGWLSSQLDKVIKHLPDLASVAPASEDSDTESDNPSGKAGKNKRGTLAAFLTTKGAKSNQTRKFLATALWLQDGGKKRLGTPDVTKALRDSNQGRLTNSSQCLNSNVSAGFCEKEGKQFFVTDDGRTEIG
jgi:hypothetical protein